MKTEEKILKIIEEDKEVVVITVLSKSGSVPRHPGAKMAVDDNGRITGTIGGGGVENEAVSYAVTFFDTEKNADIAEYSLLPGREDGNIDMVCGGTIKLLFEKISSDDKELFSQFHKYAQEQKEGFWSLDISDASKGNVNRSIYEGSSQQTGLYEKDGRTVFIERFNNKGSLIVVGGGHVAFELAKLAVNVDFNIVVIDDREDFANKERFPMAQVNSVENMENIFDGMNIDESCFIIILTRTHLMDQTVLGQALKTDAGYIGMIGSSRKRNIIYQNLIEKGVSKDKLSEVHCPIGLNIGAESPAEIAVSIVAELIKKRSEI